jgi:hypothetical protein
MKKLKPEKKEKKKRNGNDENAKRILQNRTD